MAYQSLETRIGTILMRKAGLSQNDIDEALSQQGSSGKRLGEILIDKNKIKAEDLQQALAFQLGLPFVPDLKPADVNPQIVTNVSMPFCKDNAVLPVFEDEESVRIAVSDPFHFEAIEALRLIFNKRCDLVLTKPDHLQDSINIVFERSENLIQGLENEEFDGDLNENIDLLESEDEAPVIRFVNTLLAKAVKDKASDIHIEPFEKNTVVRFRIDGILYDVYQAPKQLHAAISSRVKILGQLNIAEKRLPQDGRFKVKVAGKDIDIRLSTVPVSFGERIVMRLLDKSSVILDLATLGFKPEIMQGIHELTNRKFGIFLVTGPTGSGKSTTLAACLKNISSPDRNIITVEDPVEYNLPGVGQIAVNHKVGLTFAAGLRAILRQDPDVVMVGEIRDKETAEIAINASLTGHLVLSTLHTNDAPGAVTRIVDMGVEPFLVSSSFVGVLAQRLIRKVCPFCSEQTPVTDALLLQAGTNSKEVRERFPLITNPIIKKPVGCQECRSTGYKGRTNIAELMVVTDAIKALIVQGADANQIRKQADEEGMRSLRDSAIEKLLLGDTSIPEVLRVVNVDG